MPTNKSTHTPSTSLETPPGMSARDARAGRAPKKVENSTDATRGESLAIRAETRKAELEAYLAKLDPHETAVRADIERALASVETLLGGDNQHLSDTTAAEIDRWLESSKHLGEMATTKSKQTPRSTH